MTLTPVITSRVAAYNFVLSLFPSEWVENGGCTNCGGATRPDNFSPSLMFCSWCERIEKGRRYVAHRITRDQYNRWVEKPEGVAWLGSAENTQP